MDRNIKKSPQSTHLSPLDYALSLEDQQQLSTQLPQPQQQPRLAILSKEVDSQQQQQSSIKLQEHTPEHDTAHADHGDRDPTKNTMDWIDASEQDLHNTLVAMNNTKTDLQQLHGWVDVWVQQQSDISDIQQSLDSDSVYKVYANTKRSIKSAAAFPVCSLFSSFL